MKVSRALENRLSRTESQAPRFATFVLMMAAFLLVPTWLMAETGPLVAEIDAKPAPEVSSKQGSDAMPFAGIEGLNPMQKAAPVVACSCMFQQQTPPVTKVGATCLRARQKAAAAARARARCLVGFCSITHSVAPCQPITNGYSATAIATYRCKNPKFC